MGDEEEFELAKEFLKEIKNPEKLGLSPAKFGQRIDNYVKLMYADMAKRGHLEKIDKTFTGHKIKHGYRTPDGKYEFWLQKKVGSGYSESIDLIIWDVKRNKDGSVRNAAGTAMDHHSYNPKHPKANPWNVKHWEKKLETKEVWERLLKNEGFDVRIEMKLEDSYFWAEAKSRFAAKTKKTLKHSSKLKSAKILAKLVNSLLIAAEIGVTAKQLTDIEGALYKAEYLRVIAKTILDGDVKRAAGMMEEFKVGNHGGDKVLDLFNELWPVAAVGTLAFENLMDLLFDSWVKAAEELKKEDDGEIGSLLKTKDALFAEIDAFRNLIESSEKALDKQLGYNNIEKIFRMFASKIEVKREEYFDSWSDNIWLDYHNVRSALVSGVKSKLLEFHSHSLFGEWQEPNSVIKYLRSKKGQWHAVWADVGALFFDKYLPAYARVLKQYHLILDNNDEHEREYKKLLALHNSKSISDALFSKRSELLHKSFASKEADIRKHLTKWEKILARHRTEILVKAEKFVKDFVMPPIVQV